MHNSVHAIDACRLEALAIFQNVINCYLNLVFISKWIEFIEEPFHRLLEYWSTKTPLAELTNANLD